MEKEIQELTMSCVKEKSEVLLCKVKEHLLDYKGKVRTLIELTLNCIIEMTMIADQLDKFHKGATIASVAGSSFGIAGGITTIVGLALIPVTFGASLIVTGVGIGVAAAGGVTGASASIADAVNLKIKCKRVQEIVDQINKEMKSLKDISDNLNLEVENIQRKLDQKDIIDVRLLGRGVFTSVEISRMVELGNLATVASRGAQIAVRGVQAAAVVSGVLAAVFIVVDAVFVVKGAIDLKNGSKTEEAKKIRKCAEDLQIIFEDLEDMKDSLSVALSVFFNDE